MAFPKKKILWLVVSILFKKQKFLLLSAQKKIEKKKQKAEEQSPNIMISLPQGQRDQNQGGNADTFKGKRSDGARWLLVQFQVIQKYYRYTYTYRWNTIYTYDRDW